jgi:signal peptidase I
VSSKTSKTGASKKEEVKKFDIVKEVKELIQSLFIALILALIIRTFVVQAFSIPSSSMYPTLQVGDMLLASKFTFKYRTPNRGEIVIFKFPRSIHKRVYLINFYFIKLPVPKFIRRKKEFNFYFFKTPYPSFLYGWKDYIKRVVAVEGETVKITDGKVYINGKPLKEPYIREEPFYEFGPVKVPKGHIFVLGDNRNNSEDGHIWGFLPMKYLRAKALFRYWPPQRLGLIK